MGILNLGKINKNKQGVGREGARRGRKRKTTGKLAREEGGGTHRRWPGANVSQNRHTSTPLTLLLVNHLRA